MIFKYGSVVTGKYFFDRTKIKKEVSFLIKGMQSFMLKAPRRYGKTSLLKHLLEEDNIEFLYIDFRKTPRLEIVNNKLADFIYAKMGVKGTLKALKENAITFLTAHRTTLKVNIEVFEASVELFSSNTRKDYERLIETLDLMEQVALEQGKKFHVFFDEFQDVKKLNIDKTQDQKKIDVLEIMRGTIQHHENICYMFAGSHMTLMTEIFEIKKAPFYNFCRKFTLLPFSIEELYPQIVDAYKKNQIVFENEESLLKLLNKLGGHPANTMLVLQLIEGLMSGVDVKIVKQNTINEAYQQAQDELSDLVNEYLKEIKSKEHLHDVIYRMANKDSQTLDANSLRQKRKHLVDMGHIQKHSRGEYFIIDGFLEEEMKS